MTELVTSGSVGGMASNGCLYPEIEDSLARALPMTLADRLSVTKLTKQPTRYGSYFFFLPFLHWAKTLSLQNKNSDKKSRPTINFLI